MVIKKKKKKAKKGRKQNDKRQKRKKEIELFPVLSAEIVVSAPQVIGVTSIVLIVTLTLCVIHLSWTRETLL